MDRIHGRTGGRPRVGLFAIEAQFTEASAVVAAMASAGNRAVAAVAAGAFWEDEDDLVIGLGARAEAERSSLLWGRVARHFQSRGARQRPPRERGGSERNVLF